MNRIAVFLFAMFAVLVGCTDVEPGFVGLRIHKTGGTRGVEHTPYYGRVYAAWNVDVVEFPTTVQNVVWTKTLGEGHPADESITFTVASGITVNADVGLNFRIDPAKAWLMYTRYHQTDLAVLADGQLRNDVRDCLGDNAAGMPVEDFLGAARARLLERTTRCSQDRLSPYGVVVENIAFVNAPRIPENVQTALNASLAAQQRLAQAEATARAEVAQAEGHATAQQAAARGDAEALLTRTRADVENRRLMAEAYRALQPSLTPEVLRYLAIQHWNGQPVPTLGANTILSLPSILP